VTPPAPGLRGWLAPLAFALVGAVASGVPGCSGSRFDVSGRPWRPAEQCYGPPEVVGEATAPGGFVPEQGCARDPDGGETYWFASTTFIALLGWGVQECPGEGGEACE